MLILSLPTDGLAEDRQAAHLRIGLSTYIGDTHNVIAEELGLFKKHGLDVDVTMSTSGLKSVRLLFAGKVDVATATPTPLVFATLDPNFPLGRAGPDFVVLASLMQSSRLSLLVVRDDRSIDSPKDLEGKTLALTRGTATEYFLHAMALYYGIDTGKVHVVDATMRNMQKTLESGTIDAFIAWEPNIERIRSLSTVATTIMPGTEFYKTNWLVLTRRKFALKNQPLLERYLRVLLEAEDFLRAKPEVASRIHARRVGMPEATAIRLHHRMTFDMTLNESLLLNFRDQAEWVNLSKHNGRKQIPDFRPFFFEAPLKAVKPHAVYFVN